MKKTLNLAIRNTLSRWVKNFGKLVSKSQEKMSNKEEGFASDAHKANHKYLPVRSDGFYDKNLSIFIHWSEMSLHYNFTLLQYKPYQMVQCLYITYVLLEYGICIYWFYWLICINILKSNTNLVRTRTSCRVLPDLRPRVTCFLHFFRNFMIQDPNRSQHSTR